MENIKSAYDSVLEMFFKLDKVYSVELCFSDYINELNALKYALKSFEKCFKDLPDLNNSCEVKQLYSIMFNVDFKKIDEINKKHIEIINKIFENRSPDTIDFLKNYIIV